MSTQKSLPSGKRLNRERLLWLLFCAFMALIAADSLREVLVRPEDFAMLWGSQPLSGLWQYASREMYLLHGTLMLLWFLLGMGLALWRRPGRKILWTHIILSLLWIVADMLQTWNLNI